MTVRELLTLIDRHNLVKIERGSMIFAGYVSGIPEPLLDKDVKAIGFEPELRRKDWEKAGTWEPLQPETLPQYQFGDLDMRIYMRIKI